ncbi:MAG TPA: hypothetical protein VHC47_05415 [Mucilaginibacter sp.]|nr:hypothetical protein [Mucilaginibacter sp.]
MEVHHHPQVEKKGLKEYLLEGLMIFIAVMMGFFAESLREHISEKSRAREFAVSLFDDLKADTANLRGYIDYFSRADKNVDTLMKLLADNDPDKVPAGKLYWYGLWGGAVRTFISHDATLLELESSGSLRYFATPAFNRSLEHYDQLCQELKMFDAESQGVYTEVRKVRAQIFEFKYNDIINNISHITDKSARQARVDSFIKTNPPLLNSDKVLFNQYVELVRSRFFDRKVAMADTLLNQASALIGKLGQQYDLNDK